MSSAMCHITVTVFGKEFQLSCLPEEEKNLLAAADYINQWVAEQISDDELNCENTATMAALNIANQLLDLKKNQQQAVATTSMRIQQILNKPMRNKSSADKFGADL